MINSKIIVRKRFLYHNWWYWIPGLIMLLAYPTLYFKLYNDVNPDLIAYCSVTNHYQNFDFIQAFNSYWSPLICWLMALNPLFIKYPIETFRIITILIGLAIYYQLFFWVRLALYKSFTRFLLCILLMLLTVQLSLTIGTPDFLSVVCFLLFLKKLIRYKYQWKQTISLALLVLLCYFSKNFVLFLSLGIFVLFLTYNLFFKNKKLVLKQIALFLLIVLSGLFIWASCLKLHYSFYTISTSAIFNNSKGALKPESLVEPPFEKSLFIWEDPYYIPMESVYSGTLEDVKKSLIKKYKYNTGITIYYFQYISYLKIFILIIPFMAFFLKKDRQWRTGLLLLSVFLLNWFGYFLVFIMERYLLIGQFALYISIFCFLEILFKNSSLKIINVYTEKILFIVLFICMIKNPIDEINYGINNFQVSFNEVSRAVELNKAGILKGKKIANFEDGKFLYDYLTLSCLQAGGKYYGSVLTDQSFAEQKREIQHYNLDYIADYNDGKSTNKERIKWLEMFPIVYQDSIMKVKIYRIR